ncbi:hypothetical protein ACIBG7_27360 [Nonomuraea sp. NPDC050328]|uniref:hypothetical protein n=1 Tax=Nonomuraea sp. NPDC050328 TaxID=3364361 RepID=UPI0037AB99D1
MTAYAVLGPEQDVSPGRLTFFRDGTRWEVITYSADTIARAVTSISELAAASASAWHRRGLPAQDGGLTAVLNIWDGVAVAGAERAAAHRRLLRAAGLRHVVSRMAALEAEKALDSALSLSYTGDHRSAVLSAHVAVGKTIDAFLAAAGTLYADSTWRHRRLEALVSDGAPAPLTFDPESCWNWLSMRQLADLSPVDWTRGAVAFCQAMLDSMTVLLQNHHTCPDLVVQ